MHRVLIADDDADHRELIAVTLRRAGYEVVAVPDAAAALRAAVAGGVDVALLDVRMPGESGVALCGRLRRDPATAELPIMLISADVCSRRIAAATAAGADDYLTKPFGRGELAARLESVLLRRAAGPRPAAAATAAARAARGALAAPPPRRARRTA